MNVVDEVLNNLFNVGIGAGIFVLAYLSNMIFGIYYNVKVVKELFDPNKIIKSVYKVLSVAGGTCLLTMSITSLPIFADYVGWSIPDQYADVFSNLIIIGVYLVASCKYIVESYTKLKAIVRVDNSKLEYPDGSSSVNDISTKTTTSGRISFKDTNGGTSV